MFPGSQYVVRMELVDKSFDTIVSCILFGDEDFLPNSSCIPHPSIIKLKRCKVEYFAGKGQQTINSLNSTTILP